MGTLKSKSEPLVNARSPSEQPSLSRLFAVCTRLVEISWKTRRDMACALKAALLHGGLLDSDASAYAEAAFHAPSEMWLSRGEVLKEFDRYDIPMLPKHLYARPRQAFESGIELVELEVTASGKLLPTGSSKKPVARLLVRRDECVMFKLIMNQNADI